MSVTYDRREADESHTGYTCTSHIETDTRSTTSTSTWGDQLSSKFSELGWGSVSFDRVGGTFQLTQMIPKVRSCKYLHGGGLTLCFCFSTNVSAFPVAEPVKLTCVFAISSSISLIWTFSRGIQKIGATTYFLSCRHLARFLFRLSISFKSGCIPIDLSFGLFDEFVNIVECHCPKWIGA